MQQHDFGIVHDDTRLMLSDVQRAWVARTLAAGGRVVWDYMGLKQRIPDAVLKDYLEQWEDATKIRSPMHTHTAVWPLLLWEQTVPLAEDADRRGPTLEGKATDRADHG